MLCTFSLMGILQKRFTLHTFSQCNKAVTTSPQLSYHKTGIKGKTIFWRATSTYCDGFGRWKPPPRHFQVHLAPIFQGKRGKKGPPLDSSKLNASNSKRSTLLLLFPNEMFYLMRFFLRLLLWSSTNCRTHNGVSLFCSIMMERNGKMEWF